MRKHHQPIFFLSALMLLIAFPAFSGATQTSTEIVPGSALVIENGVWAWSDDTENQHAIFVSRQTGSQWGQPEQISDNKKVNVVPALTKTSDEDIFVVWSSFDGQQSQLRYKEFKKGAWTEETVYYSGLSANTAPAVATDGSGTLWLVWSGFNGVSDEIYFTTFSNGRFATAQPVTNNDVPDILPVIGTDQLTGNLWVRWQQFSAKGYLALESTWNGSAWTSPEEVMAKSVAATGTEEATILQHDLMTKLDTATDQSVTKEGGSEEEYQLEIPEFVTAPDTASVHIPGYAIQSLPMRNIKTFE